MDRLDQPFRHSRAWAPILAGGLLIVSGCDRRPPPIVDPDPAPIVDVPELEVGVSVEPQEDDPRNADVWVGTSHPALWKSLPRDPGAPEWEGLIVVRQQAATEAPPHDEPARAPPLKGAYAIVDGRLRFRLEEPLQTGATYRVEFHRSAIPDFDVPGAPPTLPVVLWHVVPEPKAEPAEPKADHAQ